MVSFAQVWKQIQKSLTPEQPGAMCTTPRISSIFSSEPFCLVHQVLWDMWGGYMKNLRSIRGWNHFADFDIFTYVIQPLLHGWWPICHMMLTPTLESHGIKNNPGDFSWWLGNPRCIQYKLKSFLKRIFFYFTLMEMVGGGCCQNNGIRRLRVYISITPY